VDQKILSRARAHLAARRGCGCCWKWGRVAAVIVLAVWVVHPPAERDASSVATVAEDINGDGVVDIRDALALQRALERRRRSKGTT
jgi:hypothetical protein